MKFKKLIPLLILAGFFMEGCATTTLRNSLNRHTGFANVLQSIAFSPDGKLLASGGWAGENYLELYNAGTLKLIKTFKRKPDTLNNPFIAFSPDGKHLATASLDDPMIIWDTETGREFLNFPNFTSVSEAIYASDGRITNLSKMKIVWEVAYAPDGKLLATAGPKKDVHLFDALRGQELAMLSGHTGDVKCLAFSRGGKLIATGGSDGRVLLWDVASAKKVAQTGPHSSPVTSLSFSADGKALLSTDADQGRIWALASHNSIEQIVEAGYLDTHKEALLNGIALMSTVEAIAFPISPQLSKGLYSPDGKYLAIKSYNEGRYLSFDIYQILIKNLSTRETRTIKGTYLDFAFSPNGEILATAGRGVKLWNPASGKEIIK